jgi:hypothetical protein
MFFDNLSRIRPSTSVLLAAAAVVVGVACGGDSGPPDNIVGGNTAGGGTTGGATTGGGTTGGGTTGGGTTGGGTTGGGTTGGGTTGGGTTGGGTTGGGTTGGGTTGGGAWTPPAVSKVKGTATTAKCVSTQARANGKCGSYYCGVTDVELGPEIDPNKPCGGDLPYSCDGVLTKIVTDCATKAGLMILLSTEQQVKMTNDCINADATVKEHKVKQTCIDCFVTAATCCKNNAACLSDCVLLFDTQEKCDAAQMKAGCIKPTFACSGLPDPF